MGQPRVHAAAARDALDASMTSLGRALLACGLLGVILAALVVSATSAPPGAYFQTWSLATAGWAWLLGALALCLLFAAIVPLWGIVRLVKDAGNGGAKELAQRLGAGASTMNPFLSLTSGPATLIEAFPILLLTLALGVWPAALIALAIEQPAAIWLRFVAPAACIPLLVALEIIRRGHIALDRADEGLAKLILGVASFAFLVALLDALLHHLLV